MKIWIVVAIVYLLTMMGYALLFCEQTEVQQEYIELSQAEQYNKHLAEHTIQQEMVQLAGWKYLDNLSRAEHNELA